MFVSATNVPKPFFILFTIVIRKLKFNLQGDKLPTKLKKYVQNDGSDKNSISVCKLW